MSALGHKQTYPPQKVMSAFPPKRTWASQKSDVRFNLHSESESGLPQKVMSAKGQ